VALHQPRQEHQEAAQPGIGTERSAPSRTHWCTVTLCHTLTSAAVHP
jgi:hypothetical protein